MYLFNSHKNSVKWAIGKQPHFKLGRLEAQRAAAAAPGHRPVSGRGGRAAGRGWGPSMHLLSGRPRPCPTEGLRQGLAGTATGLRVTQSQIDILTAASSQSKLGDLRCVPDLLARALPPLRGPGVERGPGAPSAWPASPGSPSFRGSLAAPASRSRPTLLCVLSISLPFLAWSVSELSCLTPNTVVFSCI